MRMRWIGGALALVVSGLALAEVMVGDVRSAQPRDGAVVRKVGRAMADVVTRLAYGTRVTVLEVERSYARIRTDDGTEGWIKASDLVEPAVLTGGGAAGPSSQADVTAAGRQFDESTQSDFQASSADLAAAYAKVDAIEKATLKPGDAAVVGFVAEGRLGRDR
jgi:hypothetical protein